MKMQEIRFRRYLEELENPKLTDKAIKSRISKGNKVERILEMSLDKIVSDDNLMYDSLIKLKPYDISGNLQNSLRKYYIFINEKEFPRLNLYKR